MESFGPIAVLFASFLLAFAVSAGVLAALLATGLAHRVLVMREGRLVGEIDRDGLAAADCEERIVRMASGLGDMKERTA